ncbi:MAG: ATP-dependent Clp protease proteolytic subunit [Victivallales bacterium]|nr:ATP-dependent Clp protease proteolytic subunit [Victivallales bacterium]
MAIRISGVIVGAMDGAFLREFAPELLEAGVYTASTDVVTQIAACKDGLDIEINSFGGCIFGGRDISIAISRWAANHPNGKVRYTVESIAASMAASLLVLAPQNAEIRCYRESSIMYHSASAFMFGDMGPGELKDTSTMLEQFNNRIKNALKSRTKLDAGQIDEWFQDRRMGWLDGDEAADCGLCGTVLNGAPEPAPDMPPKDNESKEVAQMAALYIPFVNAILNRETTMDVRKLKAKNEDEEKIEEQKAPEAAEEPEKEIEEPENEEPEEDEEEATAEGEEKPEEDEEKKELAEENARLKAQLAEVNAKLEKLTGGMRRGHNAGASAGACSFEAAFAEIRAKKLSGPEFEREYLKARNADPKGFERYIAKCTPVRNND